MKLITLYRKSDHSSMHVTKNLSHKKFQIKVTDLIEIYTSYHISAILCNHACHKIDRFISTYM